MNVRLSFTSGLILATLSSAAQAEEGAAVLPRMADRLSPAGSFVQFPFANPAVARYRHNTSLSEFSLAGEKERADRPLVAQEGSGRNAYRVSASSYYCLSDRTHVWGSADYCNARQKQVRWNESADYDLIYPYVSADTIGGPMKSETYAFVGGYATVVGRWTLGGEFSYRALLSYRDVDPRPRNTVGDLDSRLGAAYRLSPRYRLAVGGEAGKYRQTGSLDYYNEAGVSKTYHLLGLGTTYVRFDGTMTSTRYRGHRWGADVALTPTSDAGGWWCAASYRRFYFEKILPATNDIPLCDLTDDAWRIELAWMRRRGLSAFGFKASASLTDRQGSENIYGDAANSFYPLIATAQQYRDLSLAAALGAFYERQATTRLRWSLRPEWICHSDKQTYRSPAKEISLSTVAASLSAAATWQGRRDLLHISLQGSRQVALDAHCDLGTATVTYAAGIVGQNYEMQRSATRQVDATVRWVRTLRSDLCGFVEVQGRRVQYDYEGSRTYALCLSLGVVL